jgi:hypothetical protein
MPQIDARRRVARPITNPSRTAYDDGANVIIEMTNNEKILISRPDQQALEIALQNFNSFLSLINSAILMLQ